ncbi:MAG: phosphoglycerate kinase [Verrucomicrobia bacterium GWF2_51_19]|nr:MAG: phosphoglycerate kinase [Verrucomicrobia bacterium GWF2_51_19]HCJ12013.1 phosphoglycerate kinase [Opitutae bacterium]
MKTRHLNDLKVKGKRVFVRVDFNVPMNEKGLISDETRVVGAIPTIDYLVQQGARVILASHLGRPKGKRDLKYTLAPVAQLLSSKLQRPVLFLDDCVGDKVKAAVNSMKDGQVALLENLRFYAEEEKNDPLFSKQLAELADVYVNDAFGAAHRAHASTSGIAAFIKEKSTGLLMDKEIEFLGSKTEHPNRPFTVILGGAKVSDKIKVIDALLDKANNMLIGGAMAYTFALAQGKKVGKSLVEPEEVDTARAALEKAKKKGVKFLLPVDHVATDMLNFDEAKVGTLKVFEGNIDEGWQGVDIGPKTIKLYGETIAQSKTILWNGPVGVFEIAACAKGTFALAEAIAHSGSVSIIGGGDCVKAVKKSGYANKVSFISTGGGASLEYLEGTPLPGIVALQS